MSSAVDSTADGAMSEVESFLWFALAMKLPIKPKGNDLTEAASSRMRLESFCRDSDPERDVARPIDPVPARPTEAWRGLKAASGRDTELALGADPVRDIERDTILDGLGDEFRIRSSEDSSLDRNLPLAPSSSSVMRGADPALASSCLTFLNFIDEFPMIIVGRFKSSAPLRRYFAKAEHDIILSSTV